MVKNCENFLNFVNLRYFLKSYTSVVYEHRKFFGMQSIGNRVVLIKV